MPGYRSYEVQTFLRESAFCCEMTKRTYALSGASLHEAFL